jgi:predicted MFS family arabinose efflux permease
VTGVRPYLALLRNRTLLFIILAQAFAVIILVPLLHYGVGFFESKHGMPKDRATLTLGVIALVAGGLGNTLSGILGDRLARRMKGAYALLAAVGFASGLPFLLLGFTSDTELLFLPALTFGAFCYFLCMPAVNTQIANAVPARQRAMAYALAVFVLHLLGDTLAPILFGGVAHSVADDAIAQQPGLFDLLAWNLGLHRALDLFDSLGTQAAFVGFSFTLVLSSLCCFLASRSAARDEAAAALPADSGAKA